MEGLGRVSVGRVAGRGDGLGQRTFGGGNDDVQLATPQRTFPLGPQAQLN